MNYKVGQQVVVRGDLKEDEVYGDDIFVARMKEDLGKSLTIEDIINRNYRFSKGAANRLDRVIEDPDVPLSVRRMFKERIAEGDLPSHIGYNYTDEMIDHEATAQLHKLFPETANPSVELHTDEDPKEREDKCEDCPIIDTCSIR